jgi:hypothetical protein
MLCHAHFYMITSHWTNSVTVARQAWPALKGVGGHGLANIKKHLGLEFHHHDAGEDARASATVILRAEDLLGRPLDEISKAMAVRRHQEISGSPSAANHALRGFRAIYNHARRTCDLPECPTMAIEWFEDKPDGRIIENLKHWRKMIDDLPNPIHRVF